MDFAGHLKTYTDPDGKETLYPSRSAIVTSELYDGTTVTIPVMAVAKAPGWICVRQTLGNDRTWLAWVPADRVRPT
jgi:hypothetical protein